MPNMKPNRRRYPPQPLENWERYTRYLAQDEAKLADPAAPAPDIHLLACSNPTPFRNVWVGPHPETTSSVATRVFFEVQNEQRDARNVSPDVFAATALFLVFGGGLSFNDNKGHGNGLAYLRLWGNDDRTMFDRVIFDVEPGYVVRHQSPQGQQTDHHNIDLAYRTIVSAEAVRAGGRRSRLPDHGREEAIAIALNYYRRNHRASQVTITEAEYLSVLRRALRVCDQHRLGQR